MSKYIKVNIQGLYKDWIETFFNIHNIDMISPARILSEQDEAILGKDSHNAEIYCSGRFYWTKETPYEIFNLINEIEKYE